MVPRYNRDHPAKAVLLTALHLLVGVVVWLLSQLTGMWAVWIPIPALAQAVFTIWQIAVVIGLLTLYVKYVLKRSLPELRVGRWTFHWIWLLFGIAMPLIFVLCFVYLMPTVVTVQPVPTISFFLFSLFVQTITGMYMPSGS